MTETTIVSEHDDGRTVSVQVRQSITIDLPENATTGFRWAPEQIDTGMLDMREAAASYGSGTIGAGGRVAWQVTAKAAGNTVIVLKKWRPWEGDSSIIQRFRLGLHIAP